MTRLIPSKDLLEKHAKIMPQIDPSSVLAMLEILQAADEIQHAILDILEKKYQLSKGKLHVMIILHHHVQQEGITPSCLADKVGVTRATISAMLRRMKRDGLIYSFSDLEDGRGKKVCLSEKGWNFLNEVLPGHYLRITNLMGNLSETERETLIKLLKKIVKN